MNRFTWFSSLLATALCAVQSGCSYDPYPTPKPVRTPGIDSPLYVQQATYETSFTGGEIKPAVVETTVAAKPAVTEVRRYEQWTEQEAAADALGRIGAPAIPYLQQALRSNDSLVKKQAAEVLARMGSDAKPAVNDLIPLLDDPDLEVRKVAVRTLGRIGPDAAAAIPALMRTLVQPEPVPPGIVPPAPAGTLRSAEPNLLPHAPPASPQ